LKLRSSYLQKIRQQQKDAQKHKKRIIKKRTHIYFKNNSLNGGDIDWSKTMAYANSPS